MDVKPHSKSAEDYNILCNFGELAARELEQDSYTRLEVCSLLFPFSLIPHIPDSLSPSGISWTPASGTWPAHARGTQPLMIKFGGIWSTSSTRP